MGAQVGRSVARQPGRRRAGGELEARAILGAGAQRSEQLPRTGAGSHGHVLSPSVATLVDTDQPDLAPLHLIGPAGDDVDHAQERIGAVERRGGAADDFDLLHGRQGNQLGAQPVAGGGTERHRMPVDHDLDQAALRAQAARNATHRQVRDDVVVDHVDSGDVAQDLVDRLIAPALDLLATDHGGDGGRAILGHRRLGRGDHDVVEQRFQVEVGELLALDGAQHVDHVGLDVGGMGLLGRGGRCRCRRHHHAGGLDVRRCATVGRDLGDAGIPGRRSVDLRRGRTGHAQGGERERGRHQRPPPLPARPRPTAWLHGFFPV